MFPVLNTENYILREFAPADQHFVFTGLSDPAVIKYYGVWYASLEETAAQMDFYTRIWKERTGCWWKISERVTGRELGACGMNNYSNTHRKAEIGYWLLPTAWRRGVMREVLPVMIDHLFEAWNLHRLEAVVERGNERSMRAAERLGFVLEGEMRDAEMKHDKPVSLLMYSLLRPEYKNQQTTKSIS